MWHRFEPRWGALGNSCTDFDLWKTQANPQQKTCRSDSFLHFISQAILLFNVYLWPCLFLYWHIREFHKEKDKNSKMRETENPDSWPKQLYVSKYRCTVPLNHAHAVIHMYGIPPVKKMSFSFTRYLTFFDLQPEKNFTVTKGETLASVGFMYFTNALKITDKWLKQFYLYKN